MVTIYDIAKKANVSAMTVSNVINNTGRISESTRNRIKKIMAEMNYVPNSMARSLVLNETKILSLLITDITNPFFTTLARGAEDAAKRLGYKLLFSNSDGDLKKEKDYVEMIISTRADGVLLTPACDQSTAHLNLLNHNKIPFVLLDRQIPNIECDMVLGDSWDGAKKLVEHLIQLGHRRIGLINGPTTISTARDRFKGYKDALKLNDIPFDEDLVIEMDFKQFGNPETVDRLLSGPNPPTALFATNNVLAIGLMKFLLTEGIRVPKDISIVCFDDLGASVINPFFTVAAQPSYQFGELGVQLLIERIKGLSTPGPKKIILPCEIIIRGSAAPPG